MNDLHLQSLPPAQTSQAPIICFQGPISKLAWPEAHAWFFAPDNGMQNANWNEWTPKSVEQHASAKIAAPLHTRKNLKQIYSS